MMSFDLISTDNSLGYSIIRYYVIVGVFFYKILINLRQWHSRTVSTVMYDSLIFRNVVGLVKEKYFHRNKNEK